jgi:hypothetical protein
MSKYERGYKRIIVSLESVSREEQQALRDYLEENCWAWKEDSVIRQMER